MTTIFISQINSLLENIDKPSKPLEISIVLDGGAFNGGYLYGALLYLKEMEKQGYVKINKISGTSVGALCGLLYLTDDLKEMETLYSQLRENFRTNANFFCFSSIIDEFILKLDKNCYQYIENKLFINYYNITKAEHVVVSSYKSNDDVKQQLIYSSFIPFLMTDKIDNLQYIDGCTPYIFKKRTKNDEPILFINLLHFDKWKNIFNTQHDKNISNRQLNGILDIHNFFLLKNSTSMCSYVNHWSIFEFMRFRLRELLFMIIIHLFYYYQKLSPSFHSYFQKSSIYIMMKKICSDFIFDIFYYYFL